MKTTLYLGFGALFWVSVAATRKQTLKKVMIFCENAIICPL